MVRGALALSLLLGGTIVALATDVQPAGAAVSGTYTTSFSGVSCPTTGTAPTNASTWGSVTVPAGVTAATFSVIGGGGGGGDTTNSAGGAGGSGGTVTGTVTSLVTAGQVLWAKLGCGGTDSATTVQADGYTKGGAAAGFEAGGGGGSSALCKGTATAACGGGTMLAIAPGGGGGGTGDANKNTQAGGAGGSGGNTTARSSNNGAGKSGADGSNGAGGNAGNATLTKGIGGDSANASTPGTGGAGSDYSNANTIARPRAGAGAGVVPAATPVVAPAANVGAGGAGGVGGATAQNPRMLGGGGGGGLNGGGGGGGGECIGTSTCASTGTIGGVDTSAAGGGGGSSWALSTVTSPAFASTGTAACGAVGLGATSAGFGGTGGGRGCNGWATVTFTVTSSTGISFGASPTASGTPAGVAFASQPMVRTLDGSGNVVAGAITLTYSGTDSGGGTVTNATLPCATNPVTADGSGFAVFSGCSVSAPGSYTITAKNGTSLASVATGTTTVGANNSWSSTASAGSNCTSRSTATAGSFSLPATTSAGSVTVRAGGGAGGAGGNDVNSYGGDGGYGGSTTLSNFTVGSNKTLAYLLGCAGTGGAFTNSASLTAAGGTGGAGWGAGSAGGSALTPLAATMKTGGGGGGGGTVACLVASGSSCAASATPTPLAVAGGGAGGGGGGQGFKGAGTGGSGNGGSAPSANEAWYGTGTTGTGMGGSGGVGGLNGVGGTYSSTPNTTGCVPTAVAQGCGSFAGAGGGAGGTGSAGTNGTQQNGWGGAPAAGDNTPGNGGASFGGAGTAGSAGSATTGGAAGVGGNSNKVPGGGDDTTSYIEGGGGAGGGYYGGGGGGADNGHYGNSSAAGGGGGSGWANANLGGTSSFSTAGGTPGIGGSQKATGGDAFSSNSGSDGSIVATYSGNGINVVPVAQTSQNGTTATYDLKTVATAADSATTYTAASLVWSAASLPTGFSVSSAGVITAGPTATTAGSPYSLTIWVRTSAGTPPIGSVSQYWTSVTVPWTITAPPSTKLAFGTQPGGGGSGAVWGTQPVVQIQDVNSALVPSDTSTVTIAIKSGSPSGTLTCTGGLSKAAVAGVATFAGCKIDGVTGTTYQLTATDTTPTNLTAANSNQFPITVGDATKLAFGTQPGGGPSGSVWATQPTVQVLDSGGNLVSTDTSNVTLAKNTGPTGTLACTTNPQAAASGVATFAGCKITGTTGSYTLIASDGALTSIVSSSVAISTALPVANAQTVDARRGFTKNIQLTGSDPNSLPITYSVVTPASKGTVSCSSGGACTYNVTAGQTGDDSFTFKVNNGTSDSVPATVTIHITNDAPTADAKTVITPMDTAVLITLTGSDLNGDTIVFNPPIGSVTNGTVSGSGSSIQFTPDTGFQGIATFTYTVTDIDSQASAPATVAVYVGVVRWVGTVTSAVGGAPLAGIEARLVDNTVPTATDPATIATAVTNASGQYDFGPQLTRGGVDFGNYVIRFVDPANNYIPEWNVDAATRALATNVAADGSALTVSVNAALVSAARVQGTVTSIGAGHPAVTGLQVRLFKIGVAGSKATTTDANGAYKFELLTAGNYQLWFRDVSSGTWTSEWYDEATDQANATTIAVTTGQQVTINEMLAPVIPVPPPVTATVQGTVTATVGGSPVAGVQVRLYNEPYTDSAATTTDANGNYSFPGEESGNYKIWFRVVDGQQLLSEYYNNKANIGAADAIAVDGTTVTANAALDPVPPPPTKGTVSGTVYAANGTTPLAGIQVRLYADPYTSSSATTTDGNGHYSFANRSLTNYKLWFRSLTSTYASEYNENKADLASADAVTLTGASLVVDASLQAMPPPPPPNASTITGTITAADGITPLAGIQVRLYLNGVASSSTAVLTDANGVYTFTSKAPVDYQLYFRDVTNTYVSEWYDDQVNQAGALPVTAINYTVVTIDARLGHR